MATNLRLRDVHEGDVIQVDGERATVTCALVLDDEVIVVADDDHGGQLTLSGAIGAVRLLSRPMTDTIAGAAPSITNPA